MNKKAKTQLVPLINKLAKSQALRVLETKFVKENYSVQFNSGIGSGFNEMYSLIPSIDVGPGSWQRENDDLTPMNIRTDWHIALTQADRTMNIRVVLYCLQHKSIRHYPDLSAYSSGPSFLKSGQSSLIQQFNGRIGDEDLPVNKEEFTILKKFTFNLIGNVGLPNGDTTAGNSPNAQPTYKKLSYTYPLKSQLKYTPGAGSLFAQYPNGHAPFWVCGYSHTDGTTPDLLNKDIQVTYTTQMTYKDA